jgi:MYXO-CTERM domain-containing protein
LILWAALALAETGDTAFSPSEFELVHGEDADDDGWPDSVDCNVYNPSVFPGALEVCNGLDSDCDGRIDEAIELCGDGSNNDCDAQVDEGCGLCAQEGEPARGSAALVVLGLLLAGSLLRRKSN